jgi:Protein of unknown function (DUF2568)
LGALGYWGFTTGSGLLAKVIFGIGAPLVAAVIWGAFLSPRVPVQLPVSISLLLEATVFGSAAAGLVGHRPPNSGYRVLLWVLSCVESIIGISTLKGLQGCN